MGASGWQSQTHHEVRYPREMSRSLKFLLPLVMATALNGCAPPLPQLTSAQEKLARQCLELAFKDEPTAECTEQVTKPMEQAFLKLHPEFYEQLLAERKAFVEARIAEDVRRRDDLNLCLDDREAGKMSSPACEKFMAHEIKRADQDRRLRRCAGAQLDGKADAQRHCEGLSARDIEDELQMERVRRKSRS